MAELVLPGSTVPANLYLPEGTRVGAVEGDLYNICERIRTEVEGGERLKIVLQEGHPKPYVVMETSPVSQCDEFVMRTDALDARVLERLQYMLRVPLADRLKAFEVAEAKHKEAQVEDEKEELYERMGGPMYRQLHHDGFAHGRAENYPLNPRAVKKGRPS